MEQVESKAKPKASELKKPESPAENLDVKRAELEARIAELQQMDGLPVDLVRQAQEAVEARRREMAEIESQLAELDAATGARQGAG
jgi:vacuolar-type H+-ATPase subunit I/STV1